VRAHPKVLLFDIRLPHERHRQCGDLAGHHVTTQQLRPHRRNDPERFATLLRHSQIRAECIKGVDTYIAHVVEPRRLQAPYQVVCKRDAPCMLRMPHLPLCRRAGHPFYSWPSCAEHLSRTQCRTGTIQKTIPRTKKDTATNGSDCRRLDWPTRLLRCGRVERDDRLSH
jgi:hypothetical protein